MPNRTVYVTLAARVSDYLSGMARSEAATRSLERALGRLESRGLRALDVPAAAMTAIPAATAPAVGAILGLTSTLAGAGASVGVFGMALSGMGDAMSALADDDAEALREALESLTPAARALVEEVQQVGPAWGQLQDEVQSATFRPVLGDLEELTRTLLPALRQDLPMLGAAWGTVASRTAEWVSQAGQVDRISRILDGTTTSVLHLGDAVEPLGNAFLDLADTSQVFQRRVVDAVVRFARELESTISRLRASGDLDNLFEGAAVAVETLLGVLGDLSTTLITVFSQPGTQAAVTLLTSLVGSLGNTLETLGEIYAALPTPIQGVVSVLITSTGLAIAAASAYSRLTTRVTAFADGLAAVGPAGRTAATGINAASRAIGIIGGLGLALTVISGLVGWIRGLGSESGRSQEEITELAESMRQFANTGRVSGELLEEVGAGFRRFGEQAEIARTAAGRIRELQVAIGELSERAAAGGDPGQVDRWLNQIQEMEQEIGELTSSMGVAADEITRNSGEMDAALAELVGSGGATQAAITFQALSEVLREAEYSQAAINALFPEYVAAASAAAAANSPLAAGFASASQEADILSQGLQNLINAGMSLLDVFELLNGGQIAFDEANLRVTESLNTLREVLDENENSLDRNSEAGQRVWVAIGDVTQAAIAATQAVLDQTGSVHAARDTWNGYMDQLRATLREMNLTEAQIEAIISDLAAMPEEVVTRITTIRRNITIHESRGQRTATFGTPGREPEFRWGGYRARTGLGLTQAHLATSPTIHYGEEATGGEVYIPHNGIPARNRRFIEMAAGWQGGQVSWPGSGGSGGQSLDVDALASRLAAIIDSRPVSVQVDSVEVARANRRGERSLARR